MATVTDPAPSVFTILETSSILVDAPLNREGTPIGRPVFGQVARISDGRMLGRSEVISRHGDALISLGPVDPATGKAELAQAKDWGGELEARLSAFSQKAGVYTFPDTPDPTEVERFVALWPKVSAQLGLAVQVRPDPLFGKGSAWHAPKPGRTEVAPPLAEFREYYERDVRGDFGVHGSFNPEPLTAEQIFVLPTLPIELQNRHTVLSSSGIVRSRYERPGGWQRYVDVVTVLRAGAARDARDDGALT